MDVERNARIRRAVEGAQRQLERDFREERADAAANFHNAINDIIAEQNPTVETVLYVFEMIRYELMEQRHGELFSPAAKVVVQHDNGNALGIGIA